ncbi:MAG: ribonuclease PH [Candidatus Latescibacteria bacterium]|nr:ribonuclease PH [Candidatus Latescibacterota bacterium]
MQRPDGRACDQLRPVSIIRGYLSKPHGSALIQIGEQIGGTKVICSVSVEEKVPPFLEGKGRGWLTAEYGMLPGSSAVRIPRESAIGHLKGRTQEIQRLIGRTLRGIIDLQKVGQRTIYIDCDVIEADGGTRTASITGAYIALHDAVTKMIQDGLIDTSSLIDSVAAVSVGMIDGVPLLDLCYSEDSRADVDMNVVMTGSGRFIEVQGTAEGTSFSEEEMAALIRLARKGISELTEVQRRMLHGL